MTWEGLPLLVLPRFVGMAEDLYAQLKEAKRVGQRSDPLARTRRAKQRRLKEREPW